MHKKANSPPPYWQTVVTKVKNLGLRPEIIAMLNNFNQIVWDTSPPPSNPNAIAYVTNEDKNGDGKIDKIHFVLSKFPPNADEEEMDGIVEMVAKTLVHEYGHIEDFDPEKNEFPGGEGVAEQSERAFEPILKQRMDQMSVAAKNNIAKHLVKLSNHLDYNGYADFSNELDSIIRKIASNEKEDYMSEFHAKSIEDNSEEIIEDLKDGAQLDPWQKTYLAQADHMINSVEERLDQEDKINSMANALSKLFKY